MKKFFESDLVSKRGPVRRAGRWRHAARSGCMALMLAWVGTQAAAGSVSYSYDALGRLAKVVYDNGTTTTTIKYDYDAAGNRTAVTTTSP